MTSWLRLMRSSTWHWVGGLCCAGGGGGGRSAAGVAAVADGVVVKGREASHQRLSLAPHHAQLRI